MSQTSKLPPVLTIDVDTWPLELGEAALLFNQTGYYLNERAQYLQAEPFYQRALAIHEKMLDPDHPNIATVLENYADLLRKTNHEAEAEKLEARARAIREKRKT